MNRIAWLAGSCLLATLAAWAGLSSGATAQNPPADSHGAASNSAAADGATAEEKDKAARAAAAKKAKELRAERISKLPCFGCHNFEAFKSGTPIGHEPAAHAAVPEQGAAPSEEGATEPTPTAVPADDSATAAGGPAEPGVPGNEAQEPSESPTASDNGAGDDGEGDRAEGDDEEGGQEAEEDPQMPTGIFSHFAHDEEGVGHCHTCHAFSGHFRVTLRRAACGECH